ncbi:MAG: hypothetical protein IKL10_06045 [Clostridia bacterium]|nr:hypothetical protein [Clostridia bacterium]
MKKTLAFLVCLIIVFTSLTIVTANEIYLQGDDVRFSVKKEVGDRKYLEGVNIDTTIDAKGTLLWKTDFTPLGSTKTDLSFHKLSYPIDQGRSYFGLSFNNNSDIMGVGSIFEKAGLNINEIKNSLTENGETKTVTIKMKDYFDYYPMIIDLDLPGNNISWNYGVFDEVGEYYSDMPKERMNGFIKAIEDFLKIPVLDNDIREWKIEKSIGGYSYGSTWINSFSFYSYNAVFSDKCYFTFNNRVEDYDNGTSVTVDTSQIPGGYGIYVLPFDEKTVYYEQIKNVYPINGESTVIRMFPNTEMGQIYLMLHENDKYIYKIIDEKTMTDICSIEIFDYTDFDYVECANKDDYMIFCKNDYEIKVVSKNEKGEYTVAMECVIPEEHEAWAAYPYSAAHAFDGERLVLCYDITHNYYEGIRNNCELDILVITNEGIVYYSRWDCSLGEMIHENSYYSNFCNFSYYGESVKVSIE